jgi:ABC-type nitrate/sulfonate/bicarbonate transport system permease component
MRSKSRNATGIAVFAALLVVWEFYSRRAGLENYFPPPSDAIRALFDADVARALSAHVAVTLGRFFGGYFFAAALAVSLGVVLGYSRFAYSVCELIIELLRPMPSVAIIPVAILFLGIGNAMIIVVTMYAAAWPILLSTIDGVRNIDRTLIDTGRTFGLGRLKILRDVALPAAAPYIATGLRVSLPIALILVTTAEMVVGADGLGFFILDEERSLRPANMYAGVVIVALLGYALNRLFVALEARALVWQRGLRMRGET